MPGNEETAAAVLVAECRIAGALDLRSIRGELGGDVAMEEDMRGFSGSGRDLGEHCCGGAADRGVRHGLHPCYRFWVIEVEEWVGRGGHGESFEVDRYATSNLQGSAYSVAVELYTNQFVTEFYWN